MGTGPGDQYYHTRGAEGRASSGGRVKATQFLPGELKRHYDSHEHEFAEDMEPGEYERGPEDFLTNP